MKIVRFLNSDGVAKTLSWIADADYVMLGCDGVATSGAISSDPGVSATAAPLQNGVSTEIVLYSGFSGGAHDLNFPLARGQTIYCAISGSIGEIQLMLGEPSAETLAT